MISTCRGRGARVARRIVGPSIHGSHATTGISLQEAHHPLASRTTCHLRRPRQGLDLRYLPISLSFSTQGARRRGKQLMRATLVPSPGTHCPRVDVEPSTCWKAQRDVASPSGHGQDMIMTLVIVEDLLRVEVKCTDRHVQSSRHSMRGRHKAMALQRANLRCSSKWANQPLRRSRR